MLQMDVCGSLHFPEPPREDGGSRCTADVLPDQIFCRESDERMYYRPES